MQATTFVPVISSIATLIISLVVIMVSLSVSRSTLSAAREKLDRELLRSMTAKLYDVRIESYPRGMEITEALRKSQLAGNVNLSEDYLNGIKTLLDSWYSSNAGFVLSRHSAQCYAALRKVLREKPESNDGYLPEQIDGIVTARREFRVALRADILLLFNEDVIEDFLED